MFDEQVDIPSYRFSDKYRQLAAERTYQVTLAGKDVSQHLIDFRRMYIDSVKMWNEKLREQMYPVALALAQVQDAYLAMTAMLDFAEPAAVRRKLWDTDPPREQDPWATSPGILPEPPTAQQLGNARHLRDNTIAPLTKHLAETLAWMGTGAAERGKVWNTASARNTSARLLLSNLRSDEIIGELLDNHAFVQPLLWAQLEALLLDAFFQISTSPEARRDLLDSELMAIARVAARFEVIVQVTDPHDARERELAERIMSIVPETELQEQPTSLSKRLIALVGTVDDTLSRTNTFARLWLENLSSLVEDYRVTKAALTDHRRDGSLDVRALLFRSIMGLNRAKEIDIGKVWKALNELARADNPIEARRFSMSVSAAMHRARRHLDGAAAWEGLESAMALLSLYEVVVAKNEEPAMHTIGIMQAVLGASGASTELLGVLNEAPTMLKLVGDRGRRLLEVLATAKEHPLMKVSGIFGAWLSFVGAVLSTKQTPTMTATEKEIGAEKILFSGVQLVLSGLALATVPTSVASLVLFVGQTMLTSRAQWAAKLFPSVKALPGTGRYVRGVWASIEGDEMFDRVTKGSPWRGEIDGLLTSVDGYTQEAVHVNAVSFWPLTKGQMVVPQIVRGVLARQYGLDKEATALLASP
ncbi:MAG: hypothetical protein AB1Z98_02940 [Nannocystaceae bacterium]